MGIADKPTFREEFLDLVRELAVARLTKENRAAEQPGILKVLRQAVLRKTV